MELGALVQIPRNTPGEDGNFSANDGCISIAGQFPPLWPVVGKSLIHDWVGRIRRLGVPVLSVTDAAKVGRGGVPNVQTLINEGVERVLVVSLGSYAEIDLDDFVRFHHQSSNASTAAFDEEGPLGVEILDRSWLSFGECASTRPGPRQHAASEYRFRGYAKRLQSPELYRDLVSDVLCGRCALSPKGSQVDENVWIGEGAQVAPSVRFSGPCFVGEGTILRDFVSLKPFSSVENQCLIDCGTTVDGSSILPNTFLAAGLDVRRSIVDGSRLQHLDTGTVVDLRPASLGGRCRPKTRTRRERDGEPQAPTPGRPICSPVQFQPGNARVATSSLRTSADFRDHGGVIRACETAS